MVCFQRRETDGTGNFSPAAILPPPLRPVGAGVAQPGVSNPGNPGPRHSEPRRAGREAPCGRLGGHAGQLSSALGAGRQRRDGCRRRPSGTLENEEDSHPALKHRALCPLSLWDAYRPASLAGGHAGRRLCL
jgi:hypothetical protein